MTIKMMEKQEKESVVRKEYKSHMAKRHTASHRSGVPEKKSLRFSSG